MRRRIVTGLVMIGLTVVLLILTVAYVGSHGYSARAEPSRVEVVAARYVRGLMVPRAVRDRKNPVQPDPEVITDAMAHFADHCATCHANDGSGNTAIGRGLYPRAPDMRLTETQSLTDGELFYIIEEGIRFTGMPGWATGTREGARASWGLVHFIRRLPHLSATDLEEMKSLNPRSLADMREEAEIRLFLEEPAGARPADVGPAPAHHKQP